MALIKRCVKCGDLSNKAEFKTYPPLEFLLYTCEGCGFKWEAPTYQQLNEKKNV